MTITNTVDRDLARIVPEWELCDRMRRSLRMTPLSVQEVADYMGVGRNTVSTWINGHNRPSRAVLRIWADMCGVDLEWLETGQAPPAVPEGPGAYAIRDSNPEPADSEFAARIVKGRLTLLGPARVA